MLGVFVSLDFLLFFVFWGNLAGSHVFHHRDLGRPASRVRAMKFVSYTLIGSVLMLLGILTLYYQHYLQFQTLSSISPT